MTTPDILIDLAIILFFFYTGALSLCPRREDVKFVLLIPFIVVGFFAVLSPGCLGYLWLIHNGYGLGLAALFFTSYNAILLVCAITVMLRNEITNRVKHPIP